MVGKEQVGRLIWAIFVLTLFGLSGNAQSDSVWIQKADGKYYYVPVRVEAKGLISDGLGAANKALELFTKDDCDQIRKVKARKKGIGYINELTEAVTELDLKWSNGEIDDLTYYYAKAYLLEMSVNEVNALEQHTRRLATIKRASVTKENIKQ